MAIIIFARVPSAPQVMQNPMSNHRVYCFPESGENLLSEG